MQRGLLIVCAVALLLMTSAFFTVVSAPRVAEAGVRAAVVTILKNELREKFGPVADRVAPGELAKLEIQQRVASTGELLEGPVPELWGQLLARQCHYECGSATAKADELRGGLRQHVARLTGGFARVQTWASSRYAAVVSEAVGELRIFTGSNAVLLLLVVMGLWRAPAGSRLQVCALLLLTATLLVAYMYVAQQNWLMTFVLSDYLGWAYALWVSVLFGFLVDNVFLHGVVTHAIIEGLASLIPST